MNKCKNGGFTLLESLIAIALLSIVSTGILTYLTSTVNLMVTSRAKVYASQLSQQIFTSLNSLPYNYVFESDSSSADFGLTGNFGPVTAQSSIYPYLSVLERINTMANINNFDKWTISTRFMIRDLSDLDGDGKTTDLRPFMDLNSDGIDDLDAGIRYHDQNSDGDYFDFFGSLEITEEPHTHLKEVTLSIYKNNRIIHSESHLISREKFTGAPGDAAGGELRIIIDTPAQNSSIYSLETSPLQDSFNMSISKSYPSDVVVHRADIFYLLQIAGETSPAASIDFRLGYATSSIQDTGFSDMLGNFSMNAFNITNAITEGENSIWAQSTKGVHYSPWAKRDVLRDINPPEIQNITPIGTVRTKQPFVSAELIDEPIASGRKVSGICEAIITLFKNDVEVNHEYDSATGLVRLIDATTDLPPVLAEGSYTMRLEGGDNAHYKVVSTWTFIVDIKDPDNSAPSISEKIPSGTAGTNPPTISCKVHDNQSGIEIESIVMKLNGAVVVSSSNISVHYTPISNPLGGYVTYTPLNPLPSGPHTVSVTVSHWADEPVDKKTKTVEWSFNVQ